MTIRILHGDCREVLKTLPDESVHTVVTSPPYYGLRDYQVAGQIGLEASPDAYVAELVGVFREVRRVLRKDGTLWLNLGDSYAGSTAGNTKGGFARLSEKIDGVKRNDAEWATVRGDMHGFKRPDVVGKNGLKPKDLIGIPWLVAFALRADGWYLRSDIIWAKPNPMPESVTDRPTKAHEYLFLLSKSATYFYDAEAIKEEGTIAAGTLGAKGSAERAATPGVNSRPPEYKVYDGTRNKRSVWTVATQSFPEAHFATFPAALIEPCIKAGTSEKGCCAKCGAPWKRMVECGIPDKETTRGRQPWTAVTGQRDSAGGLPHRETFTRGWSPSCSCNAPTVQATVLDPFGGAGTTGLVADRLQRSAILIELNSDYAAMARSRLMADAGMFATTDAA